MAILFIDILKNLTFTWLTGGLLLILFILFLVFLITNISKGKDKYNKINMIFRETMFSLSSIIIIVGFLFSSFLFGQDYVIMARYSSFIIFGLDLIFIIIWVVFMIKINSIKEMGEIDESEQLGGELSLKKATKIFFKK